MSLGQIIKQHSLKSIQSLKLPELMEAEVVSDAPDLKIKLKGSDKLIIPKELIVVAEHLCRVKRMVNITNKGKTEIQTQKFPVANMTPSPVDSHVHTADVTVALASRNFDMQEGELHYLNEEKKDDLLKKGDKVMVISFEGGQKFFIIDRIIQY